MKKGAANSIGVLVIDDQRTMRRIVRGLLKEIGIRNVYTAGNGKEALDFINDNLKPRPDIIISDLNMDRMDGLEFCQKLRLTDSFKKRPIPILLLTGEEEELLLEVAKQVGVCSIVSKPVSGPELSEHISRAVGFEVA